MLPLFTLIPYFTEIDVSSETIGGYRFIHSRFVESGGKLVVKDSHGRTLASLYDDGDAMAESIDDLDGDKSPEVLLTAWSGGAHASFDYYVLSLKPEPRCILAYNKGNGEGTWVAEKDYYDGDLRPKDLDGDDKPELLSWSDGFAYRLGAGYAPVHIPLVLKLRKGRFEESTTSFPKYLSKAASEAWNDLQQNLRELKSEKERRETETRAYAVGYLAPKIILGQEHEAWDQLKKCLLPSEYKRLYEARGWIHSVVESRKRRVGYATLGQIPLPWTPSALTSGPWD